MKRFRTYLPMLVAAVLLALVLRKVGLGELLESIRDADPFWIAAAFILGHATYLPKMVNWRQLLRAQGHRLTLIALAQLYLVGIFFNNMLPGNVGGDVVRSYEVGRRIGDQATALASVFVERITGLAVLVAFAALALLTHLDSVNSPMLNLAMATAAIGLAGLAWVALDPRLLRLLERMLPGSFAKYLGKVKKVQAALHRYRGQRSLLRNSFILSIFFNGLAVLYSWAALSAFQDSVSFAGTLFVIPIIMVVAMMPVSFNGVGLQEWAAVLLFPSIGVTQSTALSAMLLIRAITLFTSALGGLVYMRMKARHTLVVPTVAGEATVGAGAAGGN